jgi:hypothetical protein
LIEPIKTLERDRFQEVDHDVLPKSGAHFSASCSGKRIELPRLSAKSSLV